MFIHHCSFCLKSIGAFLITAMDAFAATEEMRNLVDLQPTKKELLESIERPRPTGPTPDEVPQHAQCPHNEQGRCSTVAQRKPRQLFLWPACARWHQRALAYSPQLCNKEMRNLVDLRHLETIKADLGDKLFVILDYSGRVYPAVTAW